MRKLIAIIAVLGFGAQAMAEGADVSHSGNFRVQYFNNADVDFDSDGGTSDGPSQEIQQRLRWSPMFKVSENLAVNATLVHAAQWGLNADQYPGDGQPNTAQPEEDLLIVNEAYATWAINDESAIKVGRGSQTVADGRVVSDNDWQQVKKAFEGLLYSHDHEFARIGAFAVRGGSDSTQANNNDSANFYGLTFDFKSLPEWLKMAHLHYMIVKRDNSSYLFNGTAVTALPEENTTRLGVTLGGDSMNIDYNLTYAMYSGETTAGTTDTDLSASMYDLEVGYSLPDMMNLRVSATMHSDTGTPSGSTDSEQYDGFHYDVHNNAGLMDVVGWGNLTYMRLGVTADIQEDLTFGVDYYTFTATEDGTGTTNRRAIGPGSGSPLTGYALSLADDTKDDIGSEIDLWIKKSYSSNFSTMFRYGQFDPGDRLATDGDAWTQMYLAGEMTF